MITFSPEAFAILTEKQKDSLNNISERYGFFVARVYRALDLPKGYIEFILIDNRDDIILRGGIDPEGVVST